MLPDTFWARVRLVGDCWEWTGSILDRRRDGRSTDYGRFNGRLAHRMAYEDMVGEIPPGLVLDHLCRNGLCVNPEHLDPVTSAVNVRRGVFERAQWTHCPRGHEFTAANTYRPKDGRRRCLTCLRAAQQRRTHAA